MHKHHSHWLFSRHCGYGYGQRQLVPERLDRDSRPEQSGDVPYSRLCVRAGGLEAG
jgi:hypothetical protein